MTYKLRPYQEQVITDLFTWFGNNPTGNPIINACVGCHAEGQMILMADGLFKAVEDIKIGDKLMGDDDLDREVLELKHGTGQMFEVIPVKGKPFIVNGDHILSVYCTPLVKGDIPKYLDISVYDFLSKPIRFQLNSKLYRTKVNLFWNNNIEIPPYMLGIFLGDGSCIETKKGIYTTPNICTPDNEIVDYIIKYAESISMMVSVSEKKYNPACTYKIRNIKRNRSIRNKFSLMIENAGLIGCTAKNKFIPLKYKTSSFKDRLEILAGLLDTDGSLSRGGFDFISKSEQLSNDVAFICRSVGLAAYVSTCYKKCQTTSGEYYRVSISGDCSIIPNKVERKKAQPRKQIKNILVTGFEIKPIGFSNYYGFTLDGNHRYLLDDFTVTHNSGKSIIIAELCLRVITQWPNQRILMVVESRELVKQNYDKLKAIYPTAKAGLYSASLGRKDPHAQIVFATIGSIHNKAMHTGAFNLCLCDEAHNINRKETGVYRNMITDYTRLNPRFRVVGFTGTPFRGNGVLLTEGDEALFTDIAATVSIRELIDQGFLAPLVLRETVTKTDITGVQINKATGDYNVSQLSKAIDRTEITKAAVSEIIAAGQDRKAWLIFGVDVQHCQHIHEELKAQGIAAGIVHGKTPTAERDRIFINFKAGRLRALVNCMMATTGFDYPGIDLIGLIRNTRSTVLYTQIGGRGLRTASGKQNCLWLDFTDTTSTLGPIDQIKGRKEPKKQDRTTGSTLRVCPVCQLLSSPTISYCQCGYEFPVNHQETIRAAISDAPIMSGGKLLNNLVEVNRVFYTIHRKQFAAESLCVNYQPLDMREKSIKEWVCFDHTGYPRRKAENWWVKMGGQLPYPKNSDEANKRTFELKQPAYISVQKNGQYFEVIDHVFNASQETANDSGYKKLPEFVGSNASSYAL